MNRDGRHNLRSVRAGCLRPVFYERRPEEAAGRHSGSCLSMKLSKAAETQRMSHRGFQSLCHIRVRTVQLPPTSL